MSGEIRRVAAWFLVPALLLLLGAGVANVASSEDPEVQRRYWQQRTTAIHQKNRDALLRYQAAMAAYDSMRRDNLRGEKRLAVVAERELAQANLDRAQRELDTFSEEARRAGALPGWIRPPPGSVP